MCQPRSQALRDLLRHLHMRQDLRASKPGEKFISVLDALSPSVFFYDETRPHSQFSRELAHEPFKSPDPCAHIFLGCLTEEFIQYCTLLDFVIWYLLTHMRFQGHFADDISKLLCLKHRSPRELDCFSTSPAWWKIKLFRWWVRGPKGRIKQHHS